MSPFILPVVVRPPPSSPPGLHRRLRVTANAIEGLGTVRATRIAFGTREDTSYEVRVRAEGRWKLELRFARRRASHTSLDFVIEIRGESADVELPEAISRVSEWTIE